MPVTSTEYRPGMPLPILQAQDSLHPKNCPAPNLNSARVESPSKGTSNEPEENGQPWSTDTEGAQMVLGAAE